jgi:single-strand DNA-binding protein
MAHMTGVFRLGRDAEFRSTANGTAALSLALAYNYGRAENGGKRPSQWIDATIWGKRAETLGDYLKKGSQISALLSDVHIRTYQKKDGTEGFSLSATVQDLEFCGGGNGGQPAPKREPAPAQSSQTPAAAEFFDDDIPFMRVHGPW